MVGKGVGTGNGAQKKTGKEEVNITLHYKFFKGGLSKSSRTTWRNKPHKIQCPDKIAETNESSVFVGTPVKTAHVMSSGRVFQSHFYTF